MGMTRLERELTDKLEKSELKVKDLQLKLSELSKPKKKKTPKKIEE